MHSVSSAAFQLKQCGNGGPWRHWSGDLHSPLVIDLQRAWVCTPTFFSDHLYNAVLCDIRKQPGLKVALHTSNVSSLLACQDTRTNPQDHTHFSKCFLCYTSLVLIGPLYFSFFLLIGFSINCKLFCSAVVHLPYVVHSILTHSLLIYSVCIYYHVQHQRFGETFKSFLGPFPEAPWGAHISPATKSQKEDWAN